MSGYEYRKTYKHYKEVDDKSQGILTDEELRQFIPKAADQLEVFKSQLGEPFVSLPNGRSDIHVPVRSAVARWYLTHYYRHRQPGTPPEGSVRRAIRELEDRAGAASVVRCEHRLHAGAATYDGVPDDPYAFYLHFAGPSSEVIEIDARGANITTPTEIVFRLTPQERALPEPKRHPTSGALLEPLFNLLRISKLSPRGAEPCSAEEPRSDLVAEQSAPQRDSASDPVGARLLRGVRLRPTGPHSDQLEPDTVDRSSESHATARRENAARAAAFLLSPFQPAGPRPILLIRGPENSGKSTLARILRNFTDPTAATFQLPTASEKKLADLAAENTILAFDDIGRPRPGFQYALRKLSSGLTRTFRPTPKLNPVSYEISRPIILTQDSADPYPEELGSRVLLIELDAIPPSQRRPAGQIMRQFEELRPRLLHELSQVLSKLLRQLPEAPYPDVPRFADLARYLLAVAPDLGLSEADVRAAFQPDIHPAIAAIRDLLASTHEDTWTGTATDLLHQIPHSINLNPNHLTRLLRRHHAELPDHTLTQTRTKKSRTLVFKKIRTHRHPRSSPTSPRRGGARPARGRTPATPTPNTRTTDSPIRRINSTIQKHKFDKSIPESDNSHYDSSPGETGRRES